MTNLAKVVVTLSGVVLLLVAGAGLGLAVLDGKAVLELEDRVEKLERVNGATMLKLAHEAGRARYSSKIR